MSNPILKPGDPRFVRPPVVDGQGKNRFSDPEQPAEASAAEGAGAYAPPAAGDRPYEPRYEQTAPSRGLWLLGLSLLGLAGVATAASSFSGLAMTGWIFPLCGLVASIAAWLLAHGDLGEMRRGSRDPAGYSLTQIAMWLGVLGMLACLASVAGMIWLGLQLLPGVL
jgi:hypothetical protein